MAGTSLGTASQFRPFRDMPSGAVAPKNSSIRAVRAIASAEPSGHFSISSASIAASVPTFRRNVLTRSPSRIGRLTSAAFHASVPRTTGIEYMSAYSDIRPSAAGEEYSVPPLARLTRMLFSRVTMSRTRPTRSISGERRTRCSMLFSKNLPVLLATVVFFMARPFSSTLSPTMRAPSWKRLSAA